MHKPKLVFYTILVLAPLILYALGFRLVVPLTDSMKPSIPPGSLVLVAPTWLEKPGNNSIVLFKVKLTGTYLILHRIVYASAGHYLTKGDARPFRDPWIVNAGDIIGVAIISIPYLGYIVLFIRLLLPLIAGYVTFYFIRMVWR